MNTTEKPMKKRERAVEKWFQVLAKRRKGMKWKHIAEHFGSDIATLNRMARRAENMERERLGLPVVKKTSGSGVKNPLRRKIRVYVICENKRFYCLDKVYWDGVSRMECDCGCEQFLIHSERGKELKALREKCRTALSVGDIRMQEKPSLCSRFAEAVILDPINTRRFAI